jgi:cobyrinic acid a,c-diamide synthase
VAILGKKRINRGVCNWLFPEVSIKGIVIAGTHSGAGKTTITLGLMAALTARGYTVAPFKVGPDFIDPGHHSRVTGRASRNLDGWMLSRAYNLDAFARHTADADIAVVEGVMGLYDGYDGRSEAGSTAQMAKWLGSAGGAGGGRPRHGPQRRCPGAGFRRL